jgi:ribonuclease HI
MFELYTDGSSTGKVGNGGWAFVLIQDSNVVVEKYGGAKDTTNNRMELSGVIEGLRHIYSSYSPNDHVLVYSDSQYVIKGITEWFTAWEKKIAKGKTIKNQDLWLELKTLSDLFTNINFEWIRGHDGNDQNERCDQLAKQGKLEV